MIPLLQKKNASTIDYIRVDRKTRKWMKQHTLADMVDIVLELTDNGEYTADIAGLVEEMNDIAVEAGYEGELVHVGRAEDMILVEA